MAKLGRQTSHINVDEAIAAASVLGPIFPVRPRGKRPLHRGWQSEATTEPATITELWCREPAANIGLVCGVTTWALDIDGDEGLATIADLEDLHCWLPLGPASITGSGGMHLFFAATSRVGNSVRRLGPGLDTRGRGGFIVLPRSIHPNGNPYVWLPEREPWALPLPEAPLWLLDLLDPPRPAYRPPRRQPTTTPYVAAAMARELETVALATKSQRNETLNRAAFKLGRFVADGSLDANDVGHALVGAALATGLNEREASRTVSSGLRAAVERAP